VTNAQLISLLPAGEKRKRKLQYLQQLIKDESNGEQTPETSPRQSEAHLRSLSADYDTGPSSSPYSLPAQSAYLPMSAGGTIATAPSSTGTAASFENHIPPTTQAYSSYTFSWQSPMYDPPRTTTAWNVPAWMPSIGYPPRVAPRPENIHYSPPLGAAQPIFEQAPNPHHHPGEFVPNTNQYVLGSSYGYYNGSQSQNTPAIPSVSLSTSPPYLEGHYLGPH